MQGLVPRWTGAETSPPWAGGLHACSLRGSATRAVLGEASKCPASPDLGRRATLHSEHMRQGGRKGSASPCPSGDFSTSAAVWVTRRGAGGRRLVL